MDINFLVEKWQEFKNDLVKNKECKLYKKAREKNIPRTNKVIKEFISSKSENISEFKDNIIRIKEEELPIKKKNIIRIWGLGGFKGIGLLNILIKYYCVDKDKEKDLIKILKECFIVPIGIGEAVIKVNSFSTYLEKISETITPERIRKINPLKNWEAIKRAINPSYASTFTPGFWDMQELSRFPVYYTSCENVIKNLDEKDRYYKESNLPSENYKLFYGFNIGLIDKLKLRYKREFKFSDISTDYLDYIYKKTIKNMVSRKA